MQSETGTTPLRTRDGACGVTRFTRQGRGPTLVLIHGVGMNAAVWRPQIAPFRPR
jgi:pimeloyl-ACP methyl ester carboxylesterase